MGIELEFHDIIISLYRWFLGLCLGSSLAFFFAFILVRTKFALNISWATFGFLKALPILALVPLFQNLIGINETSKILLVAWACFFPVFISTAGSIREPQKSLQRRLMLAENSERKIYRHYLVPRLMKGLLSGIEVAIGIGWLTIVSAEFIGTFSNGPFRGGLGNFVYNAFEVGNYSKGFLGLFMFGLLGISTTTIWRYCSKVIMESLYDS